MTTAFAQRVADIAFGQWEKFNPQTEHSPPLEKQIKRYWNETVGGFKSVTDPWAAVFVSWCVKEAGATEAEFKVSASSSVFVHEAINKPGAYRGVRFDAEPTGPGDIIQFIRPGVDADFEFAGKHKNYNSTSMIVWEVGEDDAGPFAITIKGNDNDFIRRIRVPLTKDGLIQQGGRRYVSLLKCVK